MSVKVNVHYFLPHLTRDEETIEVNGNTIGECIEQVARRFPKTREWLFGEEGNLSNFIDVHVNLESAYPDAMDKPVRDGDEIYIVMTISGG